MVINGVDTDDNEAYALSPVKFPKIVKGRVAQIDADFLAYMHSAQNPKKDQKSFEDMKYNCQVSIETITRLAGAENYVLHLTDHKGNKGNRFKLAKLKEYQANRKDRKNTPPMLEEIKKWMVKELGAISHKNCEADDGMSEANYCAISNGTEKLSVICTRDKDLNMVPGLHLDWKTGVITKVKGFGKIWIDASGKQKKLVGYGTKYFWAQMLMGDVADNISGLPGVHINDKLKPVGAIATELLLSHCKTDGDALDLIGRLYKQYSETIGFKHWKTGKKIPWVKAVLSEAQLLWMRRCKEDSDDVLKWIKEIK